MDTKSGERERSAWLNLVGVSIILLLSFPWALFAGVYLVVVFTDMDSRPVVDPNASAHSSAMDALVAARAVSY